MANIKISQLPPASVVTAVSDVLPMVHEGVTQKVTPDLLVQAVLSAPGPIGNTTAGPAAFTTLTASGAVTLNPPNFNVELSPTGAGTVNIQPVGGLLINPASVGSLNNVSIGGSTPQPGTFATLTSLGTTALNGTTIPASKILADTDSAQTLTNKTISGAANTLTNIGNASLTNSSITLGSTAQALGSTVSVLNGVSIGSTTPAAGAFTTLSSTGNTTLGDASGDTVAIQAGTAALPTLIPNGDPNTGLWFPSADTIAASTSGSERLRINSSGNVGIGTSAPSEKLEIVGNVKASGYIWGVTNVYSGDGSASNNAFARSAGSGTGMYFPAANAVGFCTVATERLRIDSSGNFFLRQSSNDANNSVVFNTTVQNALTLSSNGVLTVAGGTATPAGGSTSARLLFGTTAGFGVYYGSGSPTVSAAQGSIYLRSDGSSTSTRMYVNTNGSTTWTAVTTAA